MDCIIFPQPAWLPLKQTTTIDYSILRPPRLRPWIEYQTLYSRRLPSCPWNKQQPAIITSYVLLGYAKQHSLSSTCLVTPLRWQAKSYQIFPSTLLVAPGYKQNPAFINILWPPWVRPWGKQQTTLIYFLDLLGCAPPGENESWVYSSVYIGRVAAELVVVFPQGRFRIWESN
jgi:hypothetical protein